MERSELMSMAPGQALSAPDREEASALLDDPGQPNVVGYGLGVKWTGGQPTGEPALLVFVTQKLPATMLGAEELVPTHTGEGLPTDVVSIGYVTAEDHHATDDHPGARDRGDVGVQTLRRRMRPAPAGISIGHVDVTAGTMGSVVYDLLPGASIDPPETGVGIPGTYYVLSNNHVIANSNQARLGSAIVQPGTFDGGVDPQDRIARLTRFVPIQFSPAVPLDQHNNLVDAAIGACEFEDATRQTYFSGAPRGWRRRANVAVGDLVKKTGRTTNLTVGRIQSVDATVDVNFGASGVARFRDQIVTTNISAGGDSGSLVTSLDDVAVGLLFAGSTQVTIVNHIEHVRARLRVEIAERLL
jgi:hypothetical protein